MNKIKIKESKQKNISRWKEKRAKDKKNKNFSHFIHIFENFLFFFFLLKFPCNSPADGKRISFPSCYTPVFEYSKIDIL